MKGLKGDNVLAQDGLGKDSSGPAAEFKAVILHMVRGDDQIIHQIRAPRSPFSPTGVLI